MSVESSSVFQFRVVKSYTINRKDVACADF